MQVSILFYLLFFTLQLNVKHPAAKSMIEVARTQDEETGDGTKSVIILGELPFKKIHRQYQHQIN